jgi:hypothetical protein
MTKFHNADASADNTTDSGSGFFSNLNLGNLLSTGSQLYTADLKAQTDASNAAAAVKLEQLKIQQQQAAAAAANTTSTGVVAKIKAYALPIFVTGLVVIGGISAYYYFKKKKA